jgi:tetratricopeptide (TPR) repeat protein
MKGATTITTTPTRTFYAVLVALCVLLVVGACERAPKQAGIAPPAQSDPRYTPEQQQALALINQGVQARDANAFRQGLAMLKAQHEQQPRDVQTLNLYATAVLDGYCTYGLLASDAAGCQSQKPLIRQLLTEAVTIDPRNLAATITLAVSYRDEDWAQAIQWSERVLALDPEHLSTLHLMGEGYYHLKRYAEAEAVLQRAIALADRQHDAFQRRKALEFLGRVYFDQDRYRDAEAMLQEAAAGLEQANTGDEQYWGCPYQALGVLYTKLGRRNDALENYVKAADKESTKALPQAEAAAQLYVAGDYPRALRYISRAVALVQPTPHNYRILKGFIEVMNRRYDYAAAEFYTVQLADPNNVGAQVGLGHLALIGRDYTAAQTHFAAAAPSLQNAPVKTLEFVVSGAADDTVLAYEMWQLGLAWLYANQNRHAAALPHYDALLRIKPDHLLALLGKGNSLSGLKQLDAAERVFQQVLKAYPDNAYAIAELAIVKYNRGDNAAAEDYFRKALAQDNEHYTCPYEGLGLIYLRQGKLDKAKQNFAKAIEINPDIEYKKFNGLAKIYLKEGRLDEARRLLEKSVANYPYDPEAKELLRSLEAKKNE